MGPAGHLLGALHAFGNDGAARDPDSAQCEADQADDDDARNSGDRQTTAASGVVGGVNNAGGGQIHWLGSTPMTICSKSPGIAHC